MKNYIVKKAMKRVLENNNNKVFAFFFDICKNIILLIYTKNLDD